MDLVATVAMRGSAEAGGLVDVVALRDLLDASLAAVARGRRMAPRGRERCRAAGAEMARSGVALSAIVDAYLSATRIIWTSFPELLTRRIGGQTVAGVTAVGEQLLRTADDVLAAVAAGHADARRQMLREEESERREFVDDVLNGGGDVAGLVSRAEHYGIRATAPHLVAVADARIRAGDSGATVRWVEQLLHSRLPGRDVLVATKDGRLVLVFSTAATGNPSAPDRDHVTDIAAAAATSIGADDPTWRVAVGRSHLGPTGISTSYREAVDTLDLAHRLDHPASVVHTEDVAVYRVVMRDTAAITELVDAVLSPLLTARGGQQLVSTLVAYFAAGAVTTEAARRLNLSVRAVTYRLEKIRALTQLDPGDPANWLTLHVALVGHQLLSSV